MLPEQWFYRLDGRPHGPFTPAQFEKLIRGRTVTLATEVSTDGLTWKTLHELLASASANPETSADSTSADSTSADSTEWMNAPTRLPENPAAPPGPETDPPRSEIAERAKRGAEGDPKPPG